MMMIIMMMMMLRKRIYLTTSGCLSCLERQKPLLQQ